MHVCLTGGMRKLSPPRLPHSKKSRDSKTRQKAQFDHYVCFSKDKWLRKRHTRKQILFAQMLTLSTCFPHTRRRGGGLDHSMDVLWDGEVDPCEMWNACGRANTHMCHCCSTYWQKPAKIREGKKKKFKMLTSSLKGTLLLFYARNILLLSGDGRAQRTFVWVSSECHARSCRFQNQHEETLSD